MKAKNWKKTQNNKVGFFNNLFIFQLIHMKKKEKNNPLHLTTPPTHPPTFPKRKNIEMYTKKNPKIPNFCGWQNKIVGNKTLPWPW